MVLSKKGPNRFRLDYRSSFELYKNLEEYAKKDFVVSDIATVGNIVYQTTIREGIFPIYCFIEKYKNQVIL